MRHRAFLMSMLNELDILRDVSARFESAGIDYMLTGSMAMNYYAQPRMTRDIDLVVALQGSDAKIILRLFAPDYYVSAEAVQASIAQQSLFNLIHQEAQQIYVVNCLIGKRTAIEGPCPPPRISVIIRLPPRPSYTDSPQRYPAERAFFYGRPYLLDRFIKPVLVNYK